MFFWQLVKFINGKEVISATPPPDWEEPTEEISDEELAKIMREKPEKKKGVTIG